MATPSIGDRVPSAVFKRLGESGTATGIVPLLAEIG